MKFIIHAPGNNIDNKRFGNKKCYPGRLKLLNFIRAHRNVLATSGTMPLCEKDKGIWLPIAYLLSQNMTIPPNLPQARPNEEFWSLLSREVYGYWLGSTKRGAISEAHLSKGD